MAKLYVLVIAALILSACSNPNDIRFGASPTEDMEKKADTLKKLPAEELALLSNYVAFAEKNSLKGGANAVVGKTVGEVLRDAKSWQKAQLAAANEQADRQEQAKIVAANIDAERKRLTETINNMVTVSFVKRTIYPPNPMVKRHEPVLQLEFDIENTGGRAILALNGIAVYKDLFGNVILKHPFQTDRTIPIGGHERFTVGYRVSPVWRELIKLAAAEDGKFTMSFEPAALSLDGGQTLKIPEKPATPQIPSTPQTPAAPQAPAASPVPATPQKPAG